MLKDILCFENELATIIESYDEIVPNFNVMYPSVRLIIPKDTIKRLYDDYLEYKENAANEVDLEKKDIYQKKYIRKVHAVLEDIRQNINPFYHVEEENERITRKI